jgi:hypothetical protein
MRIFSIVTAAIDGNGTPKRGPRRARLRLLLPVATLLLAMALAACGGAPPAAPAAAAAPAASGSSVTLAQDYPNAVGIQSQLLVGTFRLEGTANTITAQQAAQLVPLWQMLKALSTGTGSQAEIQAVLGQIQGAMAGEQLQAIRAMRLTPADSQALIQSLGITPPGGGPGAGGGQPGQGASLSPAERATRQAQFGGTGQAGGNAVMLDKLIELLQSKH